MSAADLLKKLPAAFDAQAAEGLNATIQFNVSQPVHAMIRDGRCEVKDGSAADSDVAITIDDADLVALLKGELNGMAAFLQGKLQVEGDLMLAQRITSLFDPARLG